MRNLKNILIEAGIEPNEAKIEVELVIEKVSGLTSKDIIMGKTLSDSELKNVNKILQQRAKTLMPIQYLIGETYFMGEKFIVDNNVLIPRDETEILVRKSVEIINKNDLKLGLDMCTGSGCIACMVAKNTDCQIVGVDISTEAIHVAFKNMENLNLFNKAVFRKSDLFSKIREDEKFDIIISNPPYIPPKEKSTIQKEVSFEPEIALYTADDLGLEFYKKIIEDSISHLNKNGYLLFELGINQASLVENYMQTFGFKNIEIIKDLAGIERVIVSQI